jgi:hypothetical protein
MKSKMKFALFAIGLGAAISSSVTSFYFLYLSLLGKHVLVYESNYLLALVEMLLLILAIGTCVVASEVYYRYLKIRENT